MRSLRLGLFRRKQDSPRHTADPLSPAARPGPRVVTGTANSVAVPTRISENGYAGVQDGGRAAGATGTGAASVLETPPATARTSGSLPSVAGVRGLPRPALRWVGIAGRIAVREFVYEADAEAVCGFQEDTYTVNFPDFRYTNSFAGAFRHDLRRASLDPQHALFVLDEGQIVGFLWLVICQNTWTGERYGYINNLYIAPLRRGQGLGRDLMQQADDFFRSRRIKRVRLTVTASNAAAVHLYEQCGYEITRWEMEKEL